MKEYMKLSQYAKSKSISYGTALRHWHLNKLNGYQDKDTGTIYIEKELLNSQSKNKVVLYFRVSSSENKPNAEKQLESLRLFALVNATP